MTLPKTRPCVRCERKAMYNKTWRKLSHEERAQLLEEHGITKLEGRGLCKTCYDWARREGRLQEFPLRTTQSEEVRRRWAELADRTRSVRSEATRLAPEFGMDPRALEQAVRRAGIRHDPAARRHRLPNGWTDEDLLEEWEALADPCATLYHEAHRLGPQFDLHPNTLLSALERLGVQSLRRAS